MSHSALVVYVIVVVAATAWSLPIQEIERDLLPPVLRIEGLNGTLVVSDLFALPKRQARSPIEMPPFEIKEKMRERAESIREEILRRHQSN